MKNVKKYSTAIFVCLTAFIWIMYEMLSGNRLFVNEPYRTIIRVLQMIAIVSFVYYLVKRFVYIPIKNKRNNKNIPNNERTN